MLAVLSFFLLAGPAFHLLDFFIVSHLSFGGFAALFLIKNKSVINRPLAILLLMLVISIVLYLSAPVEKKSLAVNTIKALLYYINSLALFTLYQRTYKSQAVAKLLDHIIIITILVSIFSVLTLFPSFREAFYPLLSHELAVSLPATIGVRAVDFAIGGGVAAAVFVSLAYITYTMMRRLEMSLLVWIIFHSLIFGAVFRLGRTGLVLLILFGFTVVTLKLVSIIYTLVTTKPFVQRFVSITIFISLILIFLGELFSTEQAQWAFELFYKFGSTNSTDRLVSNHYNLNLTGVEWLFGASSIKAHSDVGYIQLFNFGGLPFVLCFIFFFGSLTFTETRRVGFSSILLFSLILALSFKGLIWGNTRGLFVLICLIFLCFKERPIYAS